MRCDCIRGRCRQGEVDTYRPAGDDARADIHRTQKNGLTYEKPNGIDQSAFEQIGRIGARSRAATEATAGILSAATAAVGTKAVGLDQASSGLAGAIAEFVRIVITVNRAVKRCRDPLGILAELLNETVGRQTLRRRIRRPKPLTITPSRIR